MTSCGNQPLFKDGKGCGSCYQVHNLVRDAISRMSTSFFVLSATLMKMETEIDREKTRFGTVWTKSFHCC